MKKLGYLTAICIVILVLFAFGIFHLYKLPQMKTAQPPTLTNTADQKTIIATRPKARTLPVWISLSTLPNTHLEQGCLAAYRSVGSAIYYGDAQITDADQTTFSILLPSAKCVTFAKDQSHVFFGTMDGGKNKVYLFPDVDPETFFPFFDSEGPICYAKDRKHVYVLDDLGYRILASSTPRIVVEADTRTFLPIYDATGRFGAYAVDNQHIFIDCGDKPVPKDADTSMPTN